MTLENDIRGQLVKLLRSYSAYAVENGHCHPGTPDISFVPGHIECKATNQWPARPETPVKLDHPVTPQQKIFCMKWTKAGGRMWFMLHIAGEWLLFDGPVGAAHLGVATRQQLYDVALRAWTRKPKPEELVSVFGSV